MPKFMFIYREPAERAGDPSPEEMQQVMKTWMDWIGKGVQAGWMSEAGDALKPHSRVVKAGGAITDGPFAESKELVGGFSMVEAVDIDAAAKLTEGCPIFAVGGAVEVRELANVGTDDA